MISREQAVAMREACRQLPNQAAYSARSMLDVLESYIEVLDRFEEMEAALMKLLGRT